jgi:dephospho-CoA kinase
MLRIGLTGGIGSGKSTVAGIFQSLGIPIYSSDVEAKRLMREDAAVRQAIETAFGKDVYVNDQPDTKRLASIVFQDPSSLEKLNQIIHPATIADAKKWMSLQTAPYVVKESALIFESGAGEGLDLIICVYAPKSLRIQRVMQRERVDRETVLARMNKQIDEELKRRLCDRVIMNDEQQPLLQQVLKLHEELLTLSKNGSV